MTSPERWAAVRAMAEEALALPAAGRAAFLDRACGDDAALRDEVERLVSACERAGRSADFLAEPAAAFASPVVVHVVEGERAGEAARVAELRAALADHYAIERELGRGGMATVYLARDRRHERAVAIKVLRADLGASMSAERFLREIRVTARLTHPHILPLHGSGEAGGLLYYVMPFVDGESLRRRLAREPALPVGEAVRLTREVASALDYAHRHGVVHRDVKPENILLVDGHAVVADFGIARAVTRARETRDADGGRQATLRTEPGVALGTPAYMAPEQALGDPSADHRADLYALGVLAYEILTGDPPFSGSTAQEVIARHVTEPPPPLGAGGTPVPAALAELVMRLLEKRPSDRPQTAADVLRALDTVPLLPNDLEMSASRPGQRRGRPWRRPVLAVGALVVAGLAGYGAWRGLAAPPNAPARAATLAASRTGGPPSVAVLPFANTSGDEADEHFSDGLTDELIGVLGKVPGLRVAGRTSVFALKGRRLGVRAVADTLGVTTVLEGSVRRDGRRLKVATQLVNAANDSVLWTESYDRRLEDVFAVQEEIARAIASALRLHLVRQRGDDLVGGGTSDPQAYELYLRGRYVLNARTTRDGIVRAIGYFDQAVRRDPRFARAYAGLSHAHARLSVFGYGRPHDEFAKAKAAARTALALDSTLAEAHTAFAHALFVYDFDLPAAERALRRAIALDPSYTLTRIVLAIFLQDQGRFAEAVAQLDTARVYDPLAFSIPQVLGRVYVSARQSDRAIAALNEALELNPQADLAYQQLGHAYLQKGLAQEAIAAFRRAAALSGIRDSAHLAYAYAVTGDTGEAGRVVRMLLDPASRRYVPPYHIAMAYAGLGDVDEAFRWLERAFAERASFMDGVMIEGAFEPLHADPRWARLLRLMKLQP